MNNCPPFGIIYYSPKDKTQDFSKTIHWKNTRVHPPNSWHSFCAATKGKFYNITDRATFKNLHERPPKIVLFTFSWPNFYLLDVYPKLAFELKKTGATVFLGFHENSNTLNQIINEYPSYLRMLKKISCHFNAIVNANFSDHNLFWKKLTGQNILNWRFCFPEEKMSQMPFSKKSGLMIGVRSLREHSRNLVLNLSLGMELAEELDTHLTVIDEDNACRRLVSSGRLRLINRRLNWYDYLNELKKHRIILNMDHTCTFGQVVADSCFSGTLCFGGISESQKLLFPELSYQETDLGNIKLKVIRYYREKKVYFAQLDKSINRFEKYFTYEIFRKNLEKSLKQK